MASFNSFLVFVFRLSVFFVFVFLSSAQVPDNDEQFVPDYQAESCKYSMNHPFLKNTYLYIDIWLFIFVIYCVICDHVIAPFAVR